MVAVPSSEVAGFQGEAQAQTSGRSLRQIVWARLSRDRLAMVCMVVLVVYYLIAIVGPVVAGVFGISPYTLHSELISDLGGKPFGALGGISWAHPLGVEWGTGRDISAQLMYGLRISLVIATSATLMTVALGTVIGIVAGYSGGWTDNLIGRLMDLVLSFLGVGVLPPDVTFGSMLASSVSYFQVVPTYLFIPGTVLVILVVSFNLLGDALRDALDPKAVH